MDFIDFYIMCFFYLYFYVCGPTDSFLSKYVQSACKISFMQLRDRALDRSGGFLHNASILLATALVSSCLDYCN